MSPTIVAAYTLLFVLLGAIFLAVNLVVGYFLRPKLPNEEKLSVYECGEPTIGSSFVQFDLRFYVVALLFIIFDVEVAFFFPWAAAYGKATHLMDEKFAVVETTDAGATTLTPKAKAVLSGLGVSHPTLPDVSKTAIENERVIRAGAATLARTSICDILVFFAVLMVGFAYVWSRGDLDWVRAVADERAERLPSSPLSIAAGTENSLAG